MSPRIPVEDQISEVEKIIVTLKRDGRFAHEIAILKSIAEDLRVGGIGMADPVYGMLEKMLRKIERAEQNQDQIVLLDLARQVIKYWPTIRAALIQKAQAETLQPGE